MVTEQQKAEIELAKFREFSNRMALPIDPESIVKRQPPEPDILCLHDGGEYVAFELMEICASDLAKAMSKEGENTFLWLSDPTSNILKKKLSRRYETDYPVELLLYTNGRVGTPDNLLIPTIRRKIRKSRCQFRRVWFLGRKDACLVCDFS